MTLLLRLIGPVALAAAIAFIATGAEAAPGIARSAANIYKSASSGSAVVDTLTKGERVTVLRCALYWCEIHHIGPDGWVRRSQLFNPYYGSRFYFQFPPMTPDPGRMHTPGR